MKLFALVCTPRFEEKGEILYVKIVRRFDYAGESYIVHRPYGETENWNVSHCSSFGLGRKYGTIKEAIEGTKKQIDGLNPDTRWEAIKREIYNFVHKS